MGSRLIFQDSECVGINNDGTKTIVHDSCFYGHIQNIRTDTRVMPLQEECHDFPCPKYVLSKRWAWSRHRGRTYFWELETGEPTINFLGRAFVTPDELYAIQIGNHISVWDLVMRSKIRGFAFNMEKFFATDGRYVVCGNPTQVWNVDTGELCYQLDTIVEKACIQGNYLITYPGLHAWDVHTGKYLHQFHGARRFLCRMATCENYLVTCLDAWQARTNHTGDIWDIRTGKRIGGVSHYLTIKFVAISNKYAAFCQGWDKCIIYCIRDGTTIELSHGVASVQRVFMNNDELIITGTHGGRIFKLWNPVASIDAFVNFLTDGDNAIMRKCRRVLSIMIPTPSPSTLSPPPP